jgi:stage II sporulation protein D
LRDGVQGIGAVQPVAEPGRVSAGIPASLRLGMAVAESQAVIGVAVPTVVGDMTLAPGHSYQVSVTDAGLLSIRDTAGRAQGTVALPLRIAPAGSAATLLGGRHYHGALEIIAAPGAPGKLTVVNDVTMEDYLKGVLPAEMVTGWPTQALQAQAVAARTYAAANMGRHAGLGFDLYPTVSDQVYKGQDVESADTSAAVDATRGVAMTYDGALINALFFSSSGGSTDDAKAVWDVDLPYIKAVPDPDGSPNAAWQKTLSPDQLRTGLTKLTGDTGSATVDAAKLRLAIGLKSTKYQITRTGEGWQLDGSGYGHGLGMSQWGAHNRALAGQSYQDILHTYYTGIVVGHGEAPSQP